MAEKILFFYLTCNKPYGPAASQPTANHYVLKVVSPTL